jgi:hypothetical protein
MEPEEESTESAAGEFDPASYDPESFDDYVGRYSLDESPSFILTFTREEDTLFTQATGQDRLEIVATSDTTFSWLAVEASVTFHRNDEGEVHALTLHQNGEHPAPRLEDDDTAWEPDAEALGAYEGRYFSEEVETFYTVTLEDDTLVLRQRRLDDANLRPGEVDEFSAGGLTVSFERDRNGGVIGMYLANGRTRDVRFERVR